VYCVRQIVRTPTVIFNKPVFVTKCVTVVTWNQRFRQWKSEHEITS